MPEGFTAEDAAELFGQSRVLDASAILAWLRGEPGAEVVDGYLSVSFVSTVNLTEVLQKSVAEDVGISVSSLADDLEGLGVEFVDFGPEEAAVAARMWTVANPLGLGIADRACLATAVMYGSPALTADKAWKDVEWEGLVVGMIR